ncbi:MAG: FUSC family protein [Algibacter sp.]|uniref:FUSC family protein n=1 Tax=Algibacter sp. TaxID=1872428 RepID=UPI0032967C8B
MKKVFTILALIASIFSVIFSVLPISNLAIFPAIAALIFGIIAFYLFKKSGQTKKIIQFTFLLTIVALAVTTYKAIFTTTEIANTDAIEAKEVKLEEASIEELEGLDIEIDESELEDISFE